MDCISKKVKSAVLITNTVKDGSFEHFTKIYELVVSHGAEVRVPSEYRDRLGDGYNVLYLDDSELYCGADAVIILGGDGTILKGAPTAIEYGIPILGVNLGRVGYMADVGKDETEIISRLFEGRYSISERMTLRVCIERGGDRMCVYENAINDAVLHSSVIGRVHGLKIYSGGTLVSHHRGDGVIISTPTGSTAYSMSAGGPVLDPSLECICITPLCSLSPAARPMVFSADREIEIETDIDNRVGVFLSCDGFEGIDVSADTRIIISRAQKKARLISMDNEDFFSVLQNKIMSAI